jgi:pimeloyl-ACP methyl ester carboxylesterase
MSDYYPIIYVRGFAFSDTEIDETSDDPTNGFNLGTTHARQGRRQRVLKFRFPGPFVRLITEHGYRDSIAGETDSVEFVEDPMRTLWIYRYYEDYSDTFEEKGLPGRPDIENLAWKLNLFINDVVQQVYAAAPGSIPRKVILVAHSMGGLICRSMIAQVLKEDAKKHVAKVVTYGTPHGGIEIKGISRLPDFITGGVSFHGLDNFNPRRMFEYLNHKATNVEGKRSPDKLEYDDKFDPKELKKEFFEPENVLCIVGTNPADYDALRGWSRRLAGGAGSDGLVRIENAWVKDAPRVDIHRSHSGRYGIVNSNEGYQSMQRFLFGKWQAAVDLVVENPIDPDGGGNAGGNDPGGGGGGSPRDVHPRGGGGGGAAHLLDVECSLGSLSTALSMRKAEHMNALALGGLARARIHVFHLMESDLEEEEESNRVTGERRKSFRLKLSLRLRHDQYNDAETLTLSDLLMEQPVEVRVVPRQVQDAEVRYLWPNTIGWPIAELRWQVAIRENNSYVIPIPPGRSVETWGERARLYLTLTGWNREESGTEMRERLRWIGERREAMEQKRRGFVLQTVGAD